MFTGLGRLNGLYIFAPGPMVGRRPSAIGTRLRFEDAFYHLKSRCSEDTPIMELRTQADQSDFGIKFPLSGQKRPLSISRAIQAPTQPTPIVHSSAPLPYSSSRKNASRIRLPESISITRVA